MKLMTKINRFFGKILPKNLFDRLKQRKDLFSLREDFALTSKLSDRITRCEKKQIINLVFIIYMPEVFASLQSIYESALNNEHFHVTILAQPHVDNQQGLLGVNPSYEYLKEKYNNVINAYKDNEWFDLKVLCPDYVFYARPYNFHYYRDYRPENVRHYAKVCFHPYAYDMDRIADFYIVYNLQFLKNVSLVFNTSESTKERISKLIVNSKMQYPKVVCLGFSRFDLMNQRIVSSYSKPTVLWLPRWSMGKNQGSKQSNFLKYIDLFLRFASEHNEIDFIIRPHPLMFHNFEELGLYSKNDFNNLNERCKILGNVMLDTEKDYFKSLMKADILLCDYTSLLIEFFIFGRPIIYCDDASTFNYEAKQIDKVVYHAKKWEEIEKLLKKLLSGNDELKEKRHALIPFIMKDFDVGTKIVEYLQNDYYGIKK